MTADTYGHLFPAPHLHHFDRVGGIGQSYKRRNGKFMRQKRLMIWTLSSPASGQMLRNALPPTRSKPLPRREFALA
jgi:hypothetical protein